MKLFFLFLFVTVGAFVQGQTTVNSQISVAGTDTLEMQAKHPRLTALALAVLTGPIGGHRIYLGTHPRVPIIYTLTLGGGLGLLPLIDIFFLAFTKDMSGLINNPHVFIWQKE